MQPTRQSLRLKRRAIKSCERERFAKKLLCQVQKIAPVQRDQKVALYLENDGEINPKYIQNFLKKQDVSIYLPILVGKNLKFSKVSKNLKKNRFGIDEPVSNKILNAQQLNIIFMPLVGFDENKNRIGMGGGFYDRTLIFKKHLINYNNLKLYGLAFDCQKVTKIDSQPWDVTLDAVITPSKIYD